MTDIELVVKAKEDQKYAYQLFIKYENLVKKCYINFKKVNPSLRYQFEDYVSEAYIALLSGLTVFDEKKIVRREDWSFTSYFKNRLLWRNLYFLSYEKKNNKTTLVKDFYYDDKDDDSISSLWDYFNHTSKNMVYEQMEEKEQVQAFKNKLNKQETLILTLLEAARNNSSNPTLKEIGSHIGVSKQRVQVIMMMMKKKWEKVRMDFS